MAKISDYSKVENLTEDNIFLLDGSSGTKTILAPKLGKALLDLMPTEDILSNVNIVDLPSMSGIEGDDHLLVGTSEGNRRLSVAQAIFAFIDSYNSSTLKRSFYRGKSLGSVVTDEQYDAIANETFKGLFLGDYWTIGNHTWRIVDFNYWYGTGDTRCHTPHLVIMPDNILDTKRMNDTDITTSGYYGSKMRNENIANANSIIYGAFGESHILVHREYLISSVTNGLPSGGLWCHSAIDLPSEIMMYGTQIFSPKSHGDVVNNYTINKTQLAGTNCSVHGTLNSRGQSCWLRDVASGGSFATFDADGLAGVNQASALRGVRPVFGICKRNV